MKNLVFLSLSLFLFAGLNSCEKKSIKKDCIKDKHDDYYYSEDYKDSEGTVLGEDVSELTALWSVFFKDKKSKDYSYKLVVEKGDKKDVVWEEGKIQMENMNVTFMPQNGVSYTGTFSDDKKEYTVTLPNLSDRVITFIKK